MLRSCRAVICCLDTFGTMNAGNETLRQEAVRCGLLREY
jgi:hypothetical protein